MWLAGLDGVTQILGAGEAPLRVLARLRCVYEQVTGAGMTDVLVEHAAQHLVQALEVRVVYVPVAATVLQHEQSHRIDGGYLVVVPVFLVDAGHGCGEGFIYRPAIVWIVVGRDSERVQLRSVPAPYRWRCPRALRRG